MRSRHSRGASSSRRPPPATREDDTNSFDAKQKGPASLGLFDSGGGIRTRDLRVMRSTGTAALRHVTCPQLLSDVLTCAHICGGGDPFRDRYLREQARHPRADPVVGRLRGRDREPRGRWLAANRAGHRCRRQHAGRQRGARWIHRNLTTSFRPSSAHVRQQSMWRQPAPPHALR